MSFALSFIFEMLGVCDMDSDKGCMTEVVAALSYHQNTPPYRVETEAAVLG